MEKLTIKEFAEYLFKQDLGIITNFSFSEDGTGIFGAGYFSLFDTLHFGVGYWGGGFSRTYEVEDAYIDRFDTTILEGIETILQDTMEYDEGEEFVYIKRNDDCLLDQYKCRVIYEDVVLTK